MSKEYSINVPIATLKPADQIIDYLNGKASLAIVNPWFQLPGVPQVAFPNFLTVKPFTGTRPGYQILSPQIAYKTQTGAFTTRIVFTDDAGSSNLTTNIRFYPLKEHQLTLEEYNKSFKVLQKVVASRGVVKDSNAAITTECVINYQLSQAYEMALMTKMLGIKLDATDTDLSVLTKFNIALNGSQKPATTERINDYIKFNTVTEVDNRFIKSYNQTMLQMFGRSKPVIQSIIDIFADDMCAKSMAIQNLPQKSDYDVLFEQYNTVLRAAKYQNMGSACYIKEYQGTANGQQYKGKSYYTDYTLKIADKSTSKTMMKIPSMGTGKPRPMTVKDFLDVVSDGSTTDPTKSQSKPLVAKIFMGIDFDFRVYSSLGNKQAINVRYIIHLIFYMPSENNDLYDSIDYSDIYMPTPELNPMGDISQNINFETQQEIPTIDSFN